MVDENSASICWLKLIFFWKRSENHSSMFRFEIDLTLSYSSLDSEFLASTSNDGSGRVWKTDDGVPITTLSRSAVW